MKLCRRNLKVGGLLFWESCLLISFTLVSCIGLVSCTGGLPPSLQRDIATENDRLQAAQRQLQHSDERVRQDLAQEPDLFQNAPAAAGWTAALRDARQKLERAQNDNKSLTELARRGTREDPRVHVQPLLAEERTLREAATHESDTVESAANHWLEFRRDLPSSLDKMRREFELVRGADLGPVSKTVERAGQDWPAKKAVLDSRLDVLRRIPPAAETQWRSLEAVRQNAASGKATGAQLATLIEADGALSREQEDLTSGSSEITGQSGQLYYAWDKILTDLDAGHYGEDPYYRERLKTVRTHFLDASSKAAGTQSDERWVNVPEAKFHAVENDLGMAIAHKDAGLFDSEATTTPQPAGFAYVASPAQGSNQYGYWTHSGGESVWTFLPEYLLLRELLWNHDYRPVAVGEYNAYRTVQRSGRTYYGQPTPASPPKYGSHGTFTQTHYADSRYVQSGGFKGSAYASRAGAQAPAARPDLHNGSGGDTSAGRRFGKGTASPGGQRFGRSGGFRPSGRGFGRRR